MSDKKKWGKIQASAHNQQKAWEEYVVWPDIIQTGTADYKENQLNLKKNNMQFYKN